jgi:hypothetical protein
MAIYRKTAELEIPMHVIANVHLITQNPNDTSDHDGADQNRFDDRPHPFIHFLSSFIQGSSVKEKTFLIVYAQEVAAFLS